MTLEQLRIFLAVAEQLHFTRAAETLYITQPAVSAAIQTIEAEYSVKLFHRMGRRIEITNAGQLLQVEAQKILEQVAFAERQLRELNNLQRGELKIGCSLTIGNYWLPDKISRFKQLYPGIQIDCTLGNSEEISEGTALGRFDLGLVTGVVKLSLSESLEQEIVGDESLQVVVGQAHPWYEHAEILVDQLSTTAWVMREAGSGAQQIFEQALYSWGVDRSRLQVELILSSSEMVKAIVEQGVGAAAIPELMVVKELQIGTLRAVKVLDHRSGDVLDMVRPILKLKHQKRFQTQVIEAFERILISRSTN
ncbi:MAG: LysR family transcriptional regulator [Plectolyngbya sp. WJT66-NPBG17]|jgi:DNA-binding transcriptional LysR family regulator|nr:LysR family transcriptional regulator [Plectolyngbya sp. WJT66-NPBG17]MBW4529009.1 LysR family transcriptional regulator [Phormidium tanganyikae FI6-MK23]